MTSKEFQAAIHSGLGRAILYARENDVQSLRDVILDGCLHCYSVDAQSEGTRAAYMLDLVNLLPDPQFYCDEVLKALPGSQDDWDAVQRFHFATYMSFDGDQHAKRAIYESFEPGPRMGEAIAIDLVHLDGINGLLFAAAKIGALLESKPDQVDEGWLWSHAIGVFGENDVRDALSRAGATDRRIETYRLRATSADASSQSKVDTFEKITEKRYEELAPQLLALRGFDLSRWGSKASADEVGRAAHALIATHLPEQQIQHLRMFSRRPFPLNPLPLLALSVSGNPDLEFAAAAALAQVEHPSVRESAFRFVEKQTVGRAFAIKILERNWIPNDHEVALGWFEGEFDRETRHHMGRHLRHLWDRHPEATNALRMLHSLYERGPCASCREFVVERLIELDSLSSSTRDECEFDANEDIRVLVSETSGG